MLQLVNKSTQSSPDEKEDAIRFQPPQKWIAVQEDKETVLITNGWSFLDNDESEPISSFDIDAANQEGLYQPQWGITSTSRRKEEEEEEEDKDGIFLSDLGFSIRAMTRDEVLEAASQQSWKDNDVSRHVLLEGGTDPRHRKQTNNGISLTNDCLAALLSSSSGGGIFVCAIGGLPLFASTDLSISATMASGWLSFVRPLCPTHIRHIVPPPQQVSTVSSSLTQQQQPPPRVEVVCAKSGCHLGHYFGREDGYCINASALNYISALSMIPQQQKTRDDIPTTATTLMARPVSYRAFESSYESTTTPSIRILRHVLQSQLPFYSETVVLGAGCFWHVEAALRRLPGVIATCVGYAGGTLTKPTYEQVCSGTTNHAEVVEVKFDPSMLSPRILLDCFLALHDPTKVRSYGKHAAKTGQYRSCILIPTTTKTKQSTGMNNNACYLAAVDALAECQNQLGKELSTEIIVIQPDVEYFWEAEERHQLHDQKRAPNEDQLSTLSPTKWLQLYGKRNESILGSSETIAEAIEVNRLMI